MTTNGQQPEEILDSGPSDPMDDFWLEQGKGLIGGSASAIQEAASSLVKGLGLTQGIYIGILGFADFVPKNAEIAVKSLFIFPLLFWLAGLFFSLGALMTERFDINPRSPEQIKRTVTEIAARKQKNVKTAYWLSGVGAVLAVLLILFHMGK